MNDKTCISCKASLPLHHFHSKKRSRSLILSERHIPRITKRCLQCRTKRNLKYLNSERLAACRRWWLSWRETHPCCDCGESNAFLISADHMIGSNKVRCLGNYTYWAYNGGVEGMILESKKCEARCIFCHRIRTHAYDFIHQEKNLLRISSSKTSMTRRRRRQRNQVWLVQYKLQLGQCFHCKRKMNVSNVQGFDFDHINEKTKKARVSRLVNSTYGLQTIKREIEQCSLLCANCHHLKTIKKLDLGYIRCISDM